MKKFNEILATLETVDHIRAIELSDAQGALAGFIENKPGSSGSVRVYHHLFKKWGAISAEAATEGLEIYAEHTEDAVNNQGKHPNIDRLFEVINTGNALSVKLIKV